MQPLSHNPAAVAIGSQVVANGVRGIAGGTAATAEVTALLPAGADEVSAVGVDPNFSRLTRAGAAYAEAAGVYTTVDGANASTLA